MNKKILLFSRDPGGANAIIPLAKRLMYKEYIVALYGKDVALNKYINSLLEGKDIKNEIDFISLENIIAFLKRENPDLIITGTSADDLTEKFIWKASEILTIPSFAVLDQWINYGLRFSEYGVSELEKYNRSKKHDYLPAKILVMDDYAREEAIKDGLPTERVIVTGQPYFEDLIHKYLNVTSSDLQITRNLLKIPEGYYVITFASEPITDTYKETDNSDNYWGYTERTVFNELLNVLNIISDEYTNNIAIVIKIHPKESPDNYLDIIEQFNNPKIKLCVDRNTDPLDLIKLSDLVVGMSSMFLIESVILKKPVLSIQIGLKRENPFILDRRGILNSILDKENLNQMLKSIIINKNILEYNFNVVENPVSNIIGLVEKYLCRN